VPRYGTYVTDLFPEHHTQKTVLLGNSVFSKVHNELGCIPEKTTFMIKFVAPLLIVGSLGRGSRTIYKRNLCQLRKVVSLDYLVESTA
jgi:hypothetical protein